MESGVYDPIGATLRLQVQQASKQLLSVLWEQETVLNRWQQDLKVFRSTCLTMDNILPRILGVASIELNSTLATSSDLEEKGLFAFRPNHDLINLAARAFEQLENLSQNLSALAHRMDESCQQLEELKSKGGRICADLSFDALRAPMITQTQYTRTGFSAGMQPKAQSGLQYAIRDSPSSFQRASPVPDGNQIPVSVYPSLIECVGYLDLIMRAASDATSGLLSLADELKFRVTGLYLHSTANHSQEAFFVNTTQSEIGKATNTGLIRVSVTNSTLDMRNYPIFTPQPSSKAFSDSNVDNLKGFEDLPKYLKASPFLKSSSRTVNNGVGPAEGNDFMQLSLSELMVATVTHATRVWLMVQRGKGRTTMKQEFSNRKDIPSSDETRDAQAPSKDESSSNDESEIPDDLTHMSESTNETLSLNLYDYSIELPSEVKSPSQSQPTALDALMDAELELLPRSGSLASEVMTGVPLATWSAIFTALSRCRKQGVGASTEVQGTPVASRMRRQGPRPNK